MSEIPQLVWVIGIARDAATHHAPIRDEKSGTNVAQLAVLDGDGERAIPVFTTHTKAMRGIRHFMTKEERTKTRVGAALVDLGDLLETLRQSPEGTPKVDYIGVDMGQGKPYPLIRL